MLPSLQVQAHALDASPFRDLTGQVVKLDIDPFATGGTSDIYLGRFVHDIAMVEKVWSSSFCARTILTMANSVVCSQGYEREV